MLKRLRTSGGDRRLDQPVDAVHDVDLQMLIESLGLSDELAEGKLKCMCCEQSVERDSIGAIYPKEGRIEVACDNTRCMAQLLSTLNQVNEPPKE